MTGLGLDISLTWGSESGMEMESPGHQFNYPAYLRKPNKKSSRRPGEMPWVAALCLSPEDVWEDTASGDLTLMSLSSDSDLCPCVSKLQLSGQGFLSPVCSPSKQPHPRDEESPLR